MEDQKPLELTLQDASTSGIAYFVDSSGNEFFRSWDGSPIRPLIHGKDDHPMMYQFSRSHPLAEKGRKFISPEKADHYVSALVHLDNMITLVDIANSKRYPDDIRKEAYDSAVSEQERIKKDDLGVLDSIPGFKPLRKYLFMKPEEIYADLIPSISEVRERVEKK